MNLLSAFSLQHAARVAKISERQATYWASENILTPSLMYDRTRRPIRYLYSFNDLIGLRALGTLRNVHRLSLQSLRKAGERLREQYDKPWSRLVFWVRGKNLFFEDPDSGLIVSTGAARQTTQRIELAKVEAAVVKDAQALSGRRPEDVGMTERRRNVLGNQLVVRGTRVPVSSVMRLAEDGYSVTAIQRAYPSLTLSDVRAILADTPYSIVA